MSQFGIIDAKSMVGKGTTMVRLYWHKRIRKKLIRGRGGRRGDIRWTAWLGQLRSRDHGHQRMRYIAHVASFLMQSDGRVIDGDVFLEKAMVRLDELGDILTSVERRRITRAITAKLRPPDRGPANVGGSSMAGATAEMDQR
jgi:hypothetical protein